MGEYVECLNRRVMEEVCGASGCSGWLEGEGDWGSGDEGKGRGVERRKELLFRRGREKLLLRMGVEVRLELLLGGCMGGW